MNEGIQGRGPRPQPRVAASGQVSPPGSRAVLSDYPTYLSPPRPRPERTNSPLVSALGAYVLAWVAQMAVGIPVGVLLLVGGLTSDPSTPAEAHNDAYLAATVVIVVMAVAGALAAGMFLKYRRVRGAFLVAFLGVVADFAVGAAGNLIPGNVGWILGVLAGLGTMYALILSRTTSR